MFGPCIPNMRAYASRPVRSGPPARRAAQERRRRNPARQPLRGCTSSCQPPPSARNTATLSSAIAAFDVARSDCAWINVRSVSSRSIGLTAPNFARTANKLNASCCRASASRNRALRSTSVAYVESARSVSDSAPSTVPSNEARAPAATARACEMRARAAPTFGKDQLINGPSAKLRPWLDTALAMLVPFAAIDPPSEIRG